LIPINNFVAINPEEQYAPSYIGPLPINYSHLSESTYLIELPLAHTKERRLCASRVSSVFCLSGYKN